MNMNKIISNGTAFYDEKGRERIFSGVNVVDKSDYKPGKQDYPLDGEAISGFRKRGFTLIRLGFTWAKAEPQPGKYNDEYFNSISDVLDECEKQEIYVYLDMHQDLYSPVTNGDGAPAWATLTDGYTSPPTRFVWAEGYFWDRACHRAFDNFWKNTPVDGVGIQDRFALCWQYIVRRFADKKCVIGYDILNEPFPGTPGGKCFRSIVTGAAGAVAFGKDFGKLSAVRDVFSKDRTEKLLNHISYDVLQSATKKCNDIICRFDINCYAPFTERVTRKIRQVDSEKTIFLENSYYSNLGIPYSAPAISVDGARDGNQAFAPHAYDFMVDTPSYKYASDNRVNGIFSEHLKSQKRLNMPVVVGEWGGFGGDDGEWTRHIEFLLQLFDKNKWSNTYWQYNEGFFSSVLMNVFVRAYPIAVSGEILSYSFYTSEKVFRLEFVQKDKRRENEIAAPFDVVSLLLDGTDKRYKKTDGRLRFTSGEGRHTLEAVFK